MNNRVFLSDKLAEMLAIFSRKIEILSSNNELNWNKHAENALIPILNSVLDADFQNANIIFGKNYPCVDLVDRNKRISIQITSNDNFNKVKETLDDFFKLELYKDYNSIFVLFVKERAQCKNLSMKQETLINTIINNRIVFDKRVNLIDFSRLHELTQSTDSQHLEEIISKLESEIGEIGNLIIEKGPATTLIFDEDSELDLAKKIMFGLIELGIRVKFFSPKLKELVPDSLLSYCDLIFEESKESKSTIILSSSSLKKSIKYDRIPAPVLQTLKNQHHLHLLFRLNDDAGFSEFSWIRPQVFVASATNIRFIIEKASIELRKMQKIKELKSYDDFATVIKLYDNRSITIKDEKHIERKKKVGYTYLETFDSMKKRSTFYIYIYQGSVIKPTTDQIMKDYPNLKHNSQNLIVFISKERGQKQLGERLDHVKKALRAANAFYIDEFIWKQCTAPDFIEDINSANTFSDVENFITPIIKQIEGPISDFDQIQNWFNSDFDPILAITGSGGVGKTTTTKVIADKFKSIVGTSSIIFVEATDSTVLNSLLRISEYKQIDLYDFYKASNESSAIDKDLFRVNIDNGNILLIIDGLDEVFARIPEFNIGYFIASISEEFIKDIGVGKVILTCRTYFWKDQISRDSNINHIEILPFNNELAEQFFEKKFSEKRLVTKSMSIIKGLEQNDSKSNNLIMPYVLDVVGKIVEAGDDIQLEENTDYPFFNFAIKNDYVVYKLFAREEKKLNKNITIAEQYEFFIQFSVFHEGRVQSILLPTMWNELFSHPLQQNYCESLKSHPLLQEINGFVLFRYNFFESYFKVTYLANYISIENDENPNQNLINILIYDCKFGSSLLYEVSCRCGNWNSDFALRISDIVKMIKSPQFTVSTASQYYKEKAISGLFNLALTINHKTNGNNIISNTELMKSIFEKNATTLINLSLINLGASDDRIKFDFSNLTFIDSYIDSYESFWECNFNNQTVFENGLFNNLSLPKSKSKLPASISNFILPRKDSSFDDYFSWQNDLSLSREKEVRTLLDKYFKMYFSNGYLQSQRLDSIVHRRYNATMQSVVRVDILEGILKQKGVLTISFDKVSKEDRAEINKEYREDITKFVKEGTISIKIKRLVDSIILAL